MAGNRSKDGNDEKNFKLCGLGGLFLILIFGNKSYNYV